MSEYAAHYSLPFDPANGADVRAMASHLRSKGFRTVVTKRHGRSVRVWRRAEAPSPYLTERLRNL
jgi:hypothetical protein